MRILTVEDLHTHSITQYRSRHATIGGLARGESAFQLGMLRLEPDGVLGAHPATSPQLLLILSGEGWVSGSDGVKCPVQQGSVVYWSAGEMHETSTDTGLTAFVFEAVDFTTLPPHDAGQSEPQ